MHISSLGTAVVLATAVLGGSNAGSPVRAFPGAEGFGAFARGGRGGRVLFVTTLSDYVPGREPRIPGSLRAACEAEGPRTVVFRIAGTIRLRAPLVIREPFLTLAGQTSPRDGICLRDYGVTVATSEVIIRYMRFRPGDAVGRRLVKQGKHWSTDALTVSKGARNVIIDHCSCSWANDEVCSVSGAGITDVTVSWTIISESLNRSTHHKGSHGYGSLIRTNGRVTFHHNLYAFHRSRSPRPGTYGEGCILFDFRNNVMYEGGRGYSAEDPVRMNFVGNWHPATPFKATKACRFYAWGNVGEIRGGRRQSKPFRVAPVHTTSAGEAKRAVLAEAGATLPQRDRVDARVAGLVRSGGGHIIDSPEQVGSWPELRSEPPPADRDRDGMPDRWEKAHGLNPAKANDNADSDGDGYTDLEEYLNGTDPKR